MDSRIATTAVSARPAWVLDDITGKPDATGNPQIHINVISEDGAIPTGKVAIKYGWQDMAEGEEQPEIKVEEGSCSIPLQPGRLLWVQVAGDTPTDRVAGLDADHSFHIAFRKARSHIHDNTIPLDDTKQIEEEEEESAAPAEDDQEQLTPRQPRTKRKA